MFERYVERARRAVFVARYEPIQFGSPQIKAEHLLLGLLRESKTLDKLLRQQQSADLVV
jgi:ATP-dependent Clp protease ATP-binding subunit ClpC